MCRGPEMGVMDGAQRLKVGWNQTMKNVCHNEFDFILWKMVNHLDSSQKSDITRFVSAKYHSPCYMKDGF